MERGCGFRRKNRIDLMIIWRVRTFFVYLPVKI